MKKSFSQGFSQSFCQIFLMSILIFTCSLGLAHDESAPKAPPMPKEFDRIKALVGNWEATSKMGDKEDKSNVVYELTAGGTAVMEKMFAGTPHEMVSVFHASGPKIEMTHYCMLGNHPEMTMNRTDDKTMSFEMSGHGGLTSKKETHMHSLVITVKDPNHITEEWGMWENGKKTDTKVINLARK